MSVAYKKIHLPHIFATKIKSLINPFILFTNHINKVKINKIKIYLSYYGLLFPQHTLPYNLFLFFLLFFLRKHLITLILIYRITSYSRNLIPYNIIHSYCLLIILFSYNFFLFTFSFLCFFSSHTVCLTKNFVIVCNENKKVVSHCKECVESWIRFFM